MNSLCCLPVTGAVLCESDSLRLGRCYKNFAQEQQLFMSHSCTLLFRLRWFRNWHFRKIVFFTPVGHGVFYCFASRTSSGSSLWLRLRSPLFLLLGLRCLLSRPFLMTYFFSKQVLVQLDLLRCRFTALSEVNTTVVEKRSKPIVFVHEHADYVGVGLGFFTLCRSHGNVSHTGGQ